MKQCRTCYKLYEEAEGFYKYAQRDSYTKDCKKCFNLKGAARFRKRCQEDAALKAKHTATMKQWYRDHLELHREYTRKSHYKNYLLKPECREKALAYMKEWYQKNKERKMEYQRQYRMRKKLDQ